MLAEANETGVRRAPHRLVPSHDGSTGCAEALRRQIGSLCPRSVGARSRPHSILRGTTSDIRQGVDDGRRTHPRGPDFPPSVRELFGYHESPRCRAFGRVHQERTIRIALDRHRSWQSVVRHPDRATGRSSFWHTVSDHGESDRTVDSFRGWRPFPGCEHSSRPIPVRHPTEGRERSSEAVPDSGL